MIAKKHKLSRVDFAKIRENTLIQKRVGFGNLIIFKEGFQKFGIIISKKVIKKAHDRNKFKRIYFNFIKNNFEKTQPNLLYLQKVTSVENFKKDLENEFTKMC
jgi:ribonuclease P protein component